MRRCRMKSPAATPKTEIVPVRKRSAGRMPPVSARGARSAQAIPGGTPSPFLVSACKSMKRSLSSPKSWAAEMSFRVVVADPVPSFWAVMVFRGIVTGAVLPARSSAQVPPAWMWFICLMPGSGRLRIWSVTSTPPLTSLRVAVPLTPEPRLGVSWTLMPCASLAKALPPTTTAANNAMPRANPANRAAWCTIFSLRYLVAATAVLTSEAVVSVEIKAKRSAPSYLNISWVQHIDVLHITQDEIASGRRAHWTRTWENSLHPNCLELRQGEVLGRIHLPRTRVNRAETALPSLRLPALANRVLKQRHPDTSTAKEREDGFQNHHFGRRLRPLRSCQQLRRRRQARGIPACGLLRGASSARKRPWPTGVRLDLHRSLRRSRRAAHLLERPRGSNLAVWRQRRPGLPGVRGGAGDRPHSGDRGRVLDGAGDAPVGHPGGGIWTLRVRGDLPDHFLLLGDEPPWLATFYRVDLLPVPTLPGHRRDPRDALNHHGQGAPGGAAASHPDTASNPGGGRRIGHRVLQGCLIKLGLLQ